VPYNDDAMPLKKTLADFAAEARARVPEVDVDELDQSEGRSLIIDVREPDERARGHIPGSIHIPRGVIERDIEKIGFAGKVSNDDLVRPIVCYCGGGSRSLLAAHTLQEMGFSDVASLRGGFGAWGQADKPVNISR
jgi:rhodanese-related sulfurtransferase